MECDQATILSSVRCHQLALISGKVDLDLDNPIVCTRYNSHMVTTGHVGIVGQG